MHSGDDDHPPAKDAAMPGNERHVAKAREGLTELEVAVGACDEC